MNFGEELYNMDMIREEIAEILIECENSQARFCETFCADDFYDPWNTLHEEMFEAIDYALAQPETIYLAISAPRGLGKSTICESLIKRQIVFQKGHFLGYLSNSATSAERYTENVKQALLTEDSYRNFGFESILKPSDGIDEALFRRMSFSKKTWVAGGKTLVLPRGAGQQVRGLKWLRYRPDFWVVDDLEEDTFILNPTNRENLKLWFNGALMKTFSRYQKVNKMIYVDTVKHEDALLEDLLESPRWMSVRLTAYNTNKYGRYVTVDPGYMTQEELDDEVAYHQDRGIMDVFAREFGSQPTSREDNPFLKHIQYYDEADDKFIEEYRDSLINFLIVDPARTKNPKSADTGFLVCGFHPEKQRIFIRLAMGEKLHINEQYDRIFELIKQYKCVAYGVETTGLKEHISYHLKNEQSLRGLHSVHFEELQARSGQGIFAGLEGGKVGRAKSALPFYQRGVVYHNKHATAKLDLQIAGFPRNKYWDVIDCLGYLAQMLSLGELFMFTGAGTRHDYTREQAEAEYAVLAPMTPISVLQQNRKR